MDKGISTVIAVILMLIIVIALSVTAYTIMSGTLTSITSTSFSIIDVINDTVVIQNLGEAPITSLSMTLDGDDVKVAIVPRISGLVGYWSFNEGEGNDTDDNSENSNSGVLKNSTAAECFSNGACPSWATGKYGDALSFDGIGDYVGVGNAMSLKSAVGSISVWFRTADTDANARALVSISTKSITDDIVVLQKKSAGTIAIATYYNNIGQFNAQTVSTYGDNNWHNAVFVVDAAGNRLYVDGVQQSLSYSVGSSSVSAWTDGLSASMDSLRIGDAARDGTEQRFFNGTMDEVSIYNRALTLSEIKMLYSGLIPPGAIGTLKILG